MAALSREGAAYVGAVLLGTKEGALEGGVQPSLAVLPTFLRGCGISERRCVRVGSRSLSSLKTLWQVLPGVKYSTPFWTVPPFSHPWRLFRLIMHVD